MCLEQTGCVSNLWHSVYKTETLTIMPPHISKSNSDIVLDSAACEFSTIRRPCKPHEDTLLVSNHVIYYENNYIHLSPQPYEDKLIVLINVTLL